MFIDENGVIRVSFKKLERDISRCIAEYAKKYNLEFSQSENNNLVNYSILNFLNIWLENAPNACQTLYSATCNNASSEYEKRLQILLKEDQTTNVVGETCDNFDKDFYDRAYLILQKLLINFYAYDLQAENEGHKYRMPPQMSSGKYQHNFKTLCFIDAYHSKYLSLYENIFHRKKPLPLREFKDAKEYYIDGYKDLKKFIQEITNYTNPQKEEKISDYKNYVFTDKNDALNYLVKCIFLYQFENTYHFLLLLQIAVYMHQNGLDPKFPLYKFPEFKAFMYRYDMAFIGTNKIMNYRPFLPFSNDISKIVRAEPSSKVKDQILLERQIPVDIVQIIRVLYPNILQTNLSESNIIDIANFLYKDFDITSLLEQYINGIDCLCKNIEVVKYLHQIFVCSEFYNFDILLSGNSLIKTEVKRINDAHKHKQVK